MKESEENEKFPIENGGLYNKLDISSKSLTVMIIALVIILMILFILILV